MRTLLTLLALVALLALAGCGEAAGPTAGDGEPVAGDDADDGESGDGESGDGPDDDEGGEGPGEITGTLGGDPQLEGGCVWVQTDEERYEVLWPEGWQADADPVQLRDPDGEVVAREGDELTVTGALARDVVTVCQIGPVFEASDVTTG